MSRLKKFLKMIVQYPQRLCNGISLRAWVVDSNIHQSAQIQSKCKVRYSAIDKYTYIGTNASVVHAKIGSFCSIAAGVAIGGGGHNMDAVSTSPIFSEGINIFGKNIANINYLPYKKTTIGNDVWIANRAIVLQGVNIGNGAVVGAGSVVTKDVPPYAIVAGNPAKVIRYRFSNDVIQSLQELSCGIGMIESFRLRNGNGLPQGSY